MLEEQVTTLIEQSGFEDLRSEVQFLENRRALVFLRAKKVDIGSAEFRGPIAEISDIDEVERLVVDPT